MTNFQGGYDVGRRYVFICGLHRSGTSVLGRNIARMENCTGFKDTGAIEDEGQFLQDVYPISKVYGGAGKFGFDPRAHLTETSPLLTPENAVKLRQSWERYWDHKKAICVEKTPGNLLKTRFLQAAFNNSYFIVIKRHPIPVSMANQKWQIDFAPLHKLFDHWLHCYALFDEDKKYLKHVYELSYEDYVRNPDKYHREIAQFIGTAVPESAIKEVTGVYNRKYFSRWFDLLNKSRFKRYYRYIAVHYEPTFAKYGYSLTGEPGFTPEQLREAEQISASAGALCCLTANAYALLVRSMTRSKAYVKAQLRARLPGPLKAVIQRLLQKSSLEKKHPDAVAP
jgi:Sulfotransferase family